MYATTSSTGTAAASAVEAERHWCPDSSVAVRTRSSTQTLVSQDSTTAISTMPAAETRLIELPLHDIHSTFSGQCHR
jgi:hypothetical protein